MGGVRYKHRIVGSKIQIYWIIDSLILKYMGV